MSDFVCQIKNSPELNAIYESVQRDSSGMVTDNHSIPMEVGEWVQYQCFYEYVLQY